jgi:hypothetical protein
MTISTSKPLRLHIVLLTLSVGLKKAIYNNLVTWAGPAVVYSSFISILLTTNE